MMESTQPARVPFDVDVECRVDGVDEPRRYRAVNVGEGGLFVRTTRPLPVGTRVRCVFCLPDESEEMEVDTEVAWTRSGPADQIPPPGMGLTFVGIAVDDLDKLQVYVDSFEEVVGQPEDALPSEASMEVPRADGESSASTGETEREIIDLVAGSSAVSVTPPPPPKPVVPDPPPPPVLPGDFVPSSGEDRAVSSSETTPSSPTVSPTNLDGSQRASSNASPTSLGPGPRPAPGDQVHVVLGPVIVEGRIVGLPEGGMEIVGGWSDAKAVVRFADGDEMSEMGLLELGGLGEGRVRMRLDGDEARWTAGLLQTEARVPDASPAPSDAAWRPQSMLSPLPSTPSIPMDRDVGDGGSSPSLQSEESVVASIPVAPEISLSSLDQAPLVPTHAVGEVEERRAQRDYGAKATLRRAVKSKAAVTLLSCLLLVGAGAGLAAMLGGKDKSHGGSAGGIGKIGEKQGPVAKDETKDRFSGAVNPGPAGKEASSPGRTGAESHPRVAGSSRRSYGGIMAQAPSSPGGGDGQSPVQDGGRRRRKPEGRFSGRGVGVAVRSNTRPGHAGAQPATAGSNRSRRSTPRVGLAVRRRAGKVSVLLGVTGTANKLSSYWLAKPPGVVVDMFGVRAKVRPGNHKVSDAQVRFVKVVRRPGGVRFIVYTTSRAAAASAKVHSAPGLGVVTWSRKAAKLPSSQKLTMR